MKEKIKKELSTIQDEKGVEVLFAVETGSRVWGMESKDSDYDVRFVYKRPARQYLRINTLPIVIEKMVDNIDIVGFDIFKFTKLILSSNPNMIEWLMSDIPYYEGKHDTRGVYRRWIYRKFNPIALFEHYRSMCKQNYLKYLKTGNNMTHKKYLYSMRGLVNALWVYHTLTIPPIKFRQSIKDISKFMPKDVIDKLWEIIELKKEGFEGIKVSHIHQFEKYIEEFLANHYEVESRKLIDHSEIQKYLDAII